MAAKLKPFNPQELYGKMLKYYIEKRNCTKEQGDWIARRITNQQCDKHGIARIF